MAVVVLTAAGCGASGGELSSRAEANTSASSTSEPAIESATTTTVPASTETTLPPVTGTATRRESTVAADLTAVCRRVEAGLVDAALPLDADYEIFHGPAVADEFGHDLALFWSPGFDHFGLVVIDADNRVVVDELIDDISPLIRIDSSSVGDWGAAGDPDADCSSPATVRAAPVNDAEAGLRFDVGEITDTFYADGQRFIEFDRYQVIIDDRGYLSALDLGEEPILAGQTDWPFLNENSKLRYFPVANDAEFLRISYNWVIGQEFCGDGSRSGDPVDYELVNPEDLIVEGSPVALTFDGAGTVIRVRDISGC